MRLRSLAILLLCCAAAIGALISSGSPASAAVPSIVTVDSGDYPGKERGQFTSLILDAAGRPTVAYYDDLNDDLKVLHCGDVTCSSGNSVTVPDTGNVQWAAISIDLDSSGNPVVAYRADFGLRTLTCGDTDCTSGNAITMPDGTWTPASGASLELDTAGRPVVMYSAGPFLIALRCGDASCTSGNSVVDTGSQVSTTLSLALDAGDVPVVSHHTSGDLRLLRCGNPTCEAGNTLTEPDMSGDVGRWSSLALDGTGRPVISYFDNTSDDLKVLRCGDSTCSSGNSITSPDTAGEVGLYTALVLDASDNPVVSYYDATNEDLKVLHCGNPTCTSGNTITSPATTGSVGRYTSIALDGSGNPVVSYEGVDALGRPDLNVLICGDANCSSGNTLTMPDTTFGGFNDGNAGSYSSVAIDSAGRPAVSYRDNRLEDLRVTRCGDASCSSGNVISVPDTDDSGIHTSIALDSSDRPVVSYLADLPSPGDYMLRVLRCGDATCSSGNAIADIEVASIGPTRLILDGLDRPTVAYRDEDENVSLLTCGNPTCSTGNAITDIAPGGYPTIAFGADGNPVLAYSETTGVTVVDCGNPGCTSGNSTGHLDVNIGAAMTTLDLDPAGHPIVAYYEGVGGVFITIAHCSDPACSGPKTYAYPVSNLSSLHSMSMAADPSGKPIVAFVHFFDEELYVIRCGNPGCTAGNSVIPVADAVDTTGTAIALLEGNPVVSYEDDEDLKVLSCFDQTCDASVGGVAELPLISSQPLFGDDGGSSSLLAVSLAAAVGAASLVVALAIPLRRRTG